MPEFAPSLHISDRSGRVRLGLSGITFAEGPTLQEAADELVHKVLVMAMAVRSDGIRHTSSELHVDPNLLAYLWRLGEIAAAGGDVRQLLFDPNATPD
jgi:hypothetical protein